MIEYIIAIGVITFMIITIISQFQKGKKQDESIKNDE